MKKKSSPARPWTKPANSTKTAELQEFRAQPEHRPMMQELYRRAEAQLRKRGKKQRAQAGDAQSLVDSPRLLHELQVHQVELEMQNEELQKARDAMEAGLEKYSELYDFAPVGYLTLDREGVIRETNLAGANLLGIARAALVKQRFGFSVSQADRPVFAAFLKQVFGTRARGECDVRLLVERKPPMDVRMRATVFDSGRACLVAVTDITEHKLAEAATAQLAAIVKSSSDAIIGKDLNSIVTSWNVGAEKLFGYSAGEMVGRPITRLIPPDRQQEEALIMSRIKQGESVEHFETLRVAKDGRLLDVSVTVSPIRLATGQIVGASKIAHDITERKQAETVLRRSEALFSALIEQAPVGVYVVDSQLRLRQVNPKAVPTFSKVRPLIGRGFSEIMHVLWPKRVADQVVERFRHTLKTGKAYQSPEFAARRRDIGVQEIYEWQIQRVTLPAGESGVVCFFNNITERKRAEGAARRVEVLAASNRKLEQEIVRRQAVQESLKQSQQQQSLLLEQSRQMHEQQRHLARQVLLAQEDERKRISRELHDVIAQTLTGISMHLASLKLAAANDTQGLGENIARTQQLVERSVKVVHQFARELRPSALDDLGLIPALNTFMKHFKEETGLRVSLSVVGAAEQVNGDKRTVLYRVAQEALTNVARHAHASRADVIIRKLDDAISMSIKDNGKGFHMERTLHGKKKNRLGLLGMRERMEMVNGTFTVQSAPGKGTAVQVKIPLANERAAGGKLAGGIR